MSILLHAGVCVRLLCVGGVGVGARSLEGASVEMGQSQELGLAARVVTALDSKSEKGALHSAHVFF